MSQDARDDHDVNRRRDDEVVISVRGESEQKVPPERGTLRVAVRAEGPRREAVLDQVAQSADALRSHIERLVDDGAADTWSSEQISAWTTQPSGERGRRLDAVEHAAIALRAAFSDFAALGRFAAELADDPIVAVAGIEWSLTTATERRIESDVAAAAVHQARARAVAYASALDLSDVRPLAVADVGMLTAAAGIEAAPRMMLAGTARDGASRPTIDLRPADITVRATVEARFGAR